MSSWLCDAPACPADQIDIVSTHATGTGQGDAQECAALRRVFGESTNVHFNNTKSFIGHCMGAGRSFGAGGESVGFPGWRMSRHDQHRSA
ncbi:MAG: hypothetical protein R3C99_02905 [Pirellulaceae bacterium]